MTVFALVRPCQSDVTGCAGPARRQGPTPGTVPAAAGRNAPTDGMLCGQGELRYLHRSFFLKSCDIVRDAADEMRYCTCVLGECMMRSE